MLTKEKIAELENAAGVPCAHIRSKTCLADGKTPSWEILVRRPTRQAYKMYRTKSHQPATVADAQEGLVRQSCLYPTGADFDALLDRAPALPEGITPMLLKLLEGEAEEVEKV